MLGPIIRGERLSLAPAGPDDLPLFCSWFARPDVTRYLLTRFVPSPQQEEEWFRRTSESVSDVYWVMKLQGKTIGSTAIHGIDWINRHATTGTMIGDPRHWGKGYATEATRLRTAYAFEELGLERLETESFAENVGMHRALERSGYTRIATRRHVMYAGGRWHDTYLFELLREDWETHGRA